MEKPPDSESGPSSSFADRLQKARAGDQTVLNQLLGDCRSFLKKQIEHLLGGKLGARADSSDVVQESLLAGLRGFEDFRGQTEEELRAWLEAIARREVLNSFRHEHQQCRDVRKQQNLPLDANGGAGLAVGQSSPSERAVRNEELGQLRLALDALPPDYKQVLILVRLELKPWPEVARQMNRSELAVKRLFYRALECLKTAMEPSDE
jgi:RNA polymerase sigma-70 factor (ECF subfamily)